MTKLKIILTKDHKKLPKDTGGYYESFPKYKKITILEDTKSTLIHEFTHFLLDVTGKNGFRHTKKFNKIYNFLIKNLL
jgi:hypothetical protein